MSEQWTDERIDRYADIYRQAAVEYVMVPTALPNVHETFAAWLAAVIARAKREAAEEIAREIEREAASLDHLPPTDDPGVADYRMGLRHGMAGSAEHDLIGAAGIARQIGADHD